MMQLGTGIFLMFYFIPGTKEAFVSIQQVTHSVPYGWLIQSIHALNDRDHKINPAFKERPSWANKW